MVMLVMMTVTVMVMVIVRVMVMIRARTGSMKVIVGLFSLRWKSCLICFQCQGNFNESLCPCP